MLIYGDEYDCVASEFCDVLCKAMAKKNGVEYYYSGSQGYN